jgi:hypothetical protein
MKTKIFLYRNIPYDVNIASLKARYNLKLHYLEEENLFRSKFKFIEDNKDNFDSESDDDDFFNNIQDQNKNRINKNLLEKKKLKRLKVYFKEEKNNFPIIKKQNHQLNEYFKNLYASPKIYLNNNKNIKKTPINFDNNNNINNIENLKNNNNNLKETKNSFFSNFNNKNNNTIIKSNSTSHFNFFKIKKYHSFIINKDKKINNVRNLNNIIDKYKNNKIYNNNNILNNLKSSFFKSIHNKTKKNLLIRFNKLNNSIN